MCMSFVLGNNCLFAYSVGNYVMLKPIRVATLYRDNLFGSIRGAL